MRHLKTTTREQMTAISKIIEFKVSKPTDFRRMTIEYFTKSGFKHLNDKDPENRILFKRGSIISNMCTFNPLNWKSSIDIEINGADVKANFNINAAGQIPTNNDELVWRIFIDNYKKYLLDTNFDFVTENSKVLKSAKSKNLKYLGWALFGVLLFGLPGALIAYFTGIHTVTTMCAVAGATAFLTSKINKDKKKRAL